MKKKQKRKISTQLVYASLILILALAIIQTIQITRAQSAASNDPWALSFSVQNAQNVTSSTFSPFSQIQLLATVTYSNASQPDTLVAFEVQNPSNTMNITDIGTTNDAGQTDFSFRLPTQDPNNGTIIGMWQATATIETTNGPLQQNLTFNTQWIMEITSITLQNMQGKNQTSFSPGNNVMVKLSLNNDGQAQAANITLSMQDAQGNIINQTQIQNKQISSSNSSQVQADLQISSNATTGQAQITAALYSGNYQGINIPIAENKTAIFTITSSAKSTPKPQTTQNSVSLFSWLLVATGLFTFTTLFMFMRRKPTSKIETQSSNLSPTTPTLSLAASSFTQPTQQETTPSTTADSLAKVAPEKTIQATATTQQLTEQNQTIQTPPITSAIPELADKLDWESTFVQEPEYQATLTHLNKISNSAKKIQTLKMILKLEKEQLNTALADLDKNIDEQEKALNKDQEAITGEIKKLKALLTDKEDQTPQNSPNP